MGCRNGPILLSFHSVLARVSLSCGHFSLRRETWIKVLSWLTQKTYKIIILTCIMLVWERYGECRYDSERALYIFSPHLCGSWRI